MSLPDDKMDSRVNQFLERIGTGVIDYRRLEREIPEEIQLIERELNATP
jgi:hypothetical protein